MDEQQLMRKMMGMPPEPGWDPLQWILVIAVILLVPVLLVWVNRPRLDDEREAEEYWSERRETDEDDWPEPEQLLSDAIAHSLPAMSVDDALDGLEKLEELERATLDALAADRAAATFIDADGYHYIIPENAAEEDEFTAVELKYEEVLAGIARQRTHLHGVVIDHLHLRRIEAEKLRDDDLMAYSLEIEAIRRLEERYQRFEASDEW